ncbi:hypothetical protein P3T76_007455 [Phytophthora citrophthora]|uniref:Uncharacterized protein n=1 Tax=Phytophthora citrophthora TaxID=4793 RepID=A0AAD9LNY6_9STRA|nr:hypothetical protein P3T76_007455 [Phytophthora citrophthora]
MATVRPPPPREAANKKKRKRIQQVKSSSSSVDEQLHTLEQWHRALTVDISELRREGGRVRVELEKVDDVAEAAVEKAENCVAQAQAAAKAAKTKDEALQSAQNKLQATETRHQTELEKLNKRFVTADKKLERYQKSSINEEFLMAQLTELQEQYENELTKVREDHDAVLEEQQKRLVLLEKRLEGVEEDKTMMKKMEKKLLSLSEENTRLTRQLTQMATKLEIRDLRKKWEMSERENQDEQGRTRVDLNNFEDKLAELDGRISNTDNKFFDMSRKVEKVEAAAVTPSYPPPLPPPPLPPPPLELPRDLVRQGELEGIHDALRRIGRDFAAVDVDISSIKKNADSRGVQQDKHFESRLQELSTQLFDALSHDSRMHATEISRLKDAVFDVQSENRGFGQRMRRVEDDVQQAVANTRAPPRSPPRWRYGQNQPPLLPTPPPPPTNNRNRRDRPSRYEPALDTRDIPEPPPQDRIRWAPRRTNRSRSRSPPRRHPWAADPVPNPPQNDRRNPSDNQRNHHTGGALVPARNNAAGQTNVPTLPVDVPANNQDEQAGQQPRRARQPRRAPEVIVIEEDEEEEGEENADDEEERGDREVEAPRATPDVVLDEEASSAGDVIMVDLSDANTDNVETTTTDVLEKEGDLQTGFLLYFCLGGAPDLDVQWTNCFTQLNADDSVEKSRALRFQQRYNFLQSFPADLTQCILQAVILNVSEGDNRPTGALTTGTVRTKFNELVQDVHLTWVIALNEHLTKQAGSKCVDELASENLALAVNPAGMSSSKDKDEVIYVWSRRQETVMWMLVKNSHYGSFLPAMKRNVDASPAVYLFMLMFDILSVESKCPQLGNFRLNAFGAKTLAHLWNLHLKKLPYVFSAEWAWLEDHSTKEKLPVLAFCHLLTTILLWNSAIDRHSLTNPHIYAFAVKHLLPKVYVGGRAVHESCDNTSLSLAECDSTPIELFDLDGKFASILGLDGFFEVTEAIQNNMLALAAAVAAKRST